MNYSEAVAQAAAALVRGDDANWELARLTWENTINIPGANSQPGRVSMEQWCKDVRETSGRRFSRSNGERFKHMWAVYAPPNLREAPEWTEALYAIEPRSDSAVIPLTSSVQTATPEQKREVVTRLLADPEIADTVMAERENRQAIHGAMQRREQRAEVRLNNITASDPILRRIDKETALLDLEQLLRKFAEQARALVATIGTLPERSPGAIEPHLFLKQSFVAAEDAIGGVRTLIETGTSDINNFLNSVLRGEQ